MKHLFSCRVFGNQDQGGISPDKTEMPLEVKIGPSFDLTEKKLCPMLKEISQRKFSKDLAFYTDDGVVVAHKLILGAQSKYMR